MEELSEVMEGFASGNLLSPVSHRTRVAIMTVSMHIQCYSMYNHLYVSL